MQHDFVLLDRSGSMGTKWDETLGAVNAYVAKLAEDKVDTGVTLATFDSPMGNISFEVIRDRIIPSTWRQVSRQDATPRGYTPLNDAIGRIVSLANAGINGIAYSKVALIIVTDGMENASREYTHGQAKALLNECRAKGWQVIFIGADFDNTAQAASYDNAAGQTTSVVPEKMGLAMRSTAAKRGRYGATGQAMAYSEAEKTELNSKQ